MSQPAPVTTELDWDRLNGTLRLIGRDINNLYQRISGDEEPETDPETTEDIVPEPEYELDPADDTDTQHLDEDERQQRLEYEIDGEADGDYDRDQADPQDPEMGA
ncbi:hypothetical protein Q0Z83_110400 [Actinoplanes sichuanensis]|uniref:Uncharacterized protein n=1 Tax=Actinoplanes sichuanensis TaxID=512349 RepID=A0ABW4A1T8_9ACTN|nr:hypothetical protein [Actinoplanes sichuanensis]BEL12849.1 hypothetical protein Q0Z83_110400 [Actinoplanes sichuanensis]